MLSTKLNTTLYILIVYYEKLMPLNTNVIQNKIMVSGHIWNFITFIAAPGRFPTADILFIQIHCQPD